MDYSAGIMSHSFWYLETKNTAEYMADDISKNELMELSLNENIYQVDSERRARELVNVCYRRLKGFDNDLLTYLSTCDQNSGKLLVLISVLADDKLFFEFMHEVFREHVLLGNFTIKNSDLDIFFMNKMNQSEVIENWTETTLGKVKANYKKYLIEAGLLQKENDDYKIILPFIDYRLNELITQNNLTPYLNAITGGL
ncbi:MAG: DUF1819 family protein [Methanobrevibacter thaueri]|nr:DUF1819 family protein [Methanobrevibacter thaueri]